MTVHRGKSVSQAEFKRLWEDETLTIAEIGLILNVQSTSVSLRAKKRGLPKRMGGRKYKQIDTARLAAMWEARVDRGEIAAFFGLSESQLHRLARRDGLKPGYLRPLLTIAEFEAQQLVEKMRADAAAIRTQWARADMVDYEPHSSGRRAA